MTVKKVQSSVAGVSPLTKNHQKSIQSEGCTFTEDEIRAILPSIDGATVLGARDYALAVLSLESGNVAACLSPPQVRHSWQLGTDARPTRGRTGSLRTWYGSGAGGRATAT